MKSSLLLFQAFTQLNNIQMLKNITSKTIVSVREWLKKRKKKRLNSHPVHWQGKLNRLIGIRHPAAMSVAGCISTPSGASVSSASSLLDAF